MERLQLDGSLWLDDAQELEVVAGVNVDTSRLRSIGFFIFGRTVFPPPPCVLLNLYS